MRRALALVATVGCAGGDDDATEPAATVDPDDFRLDWRLEREDDPAGELRGVWGSAADDVWVVGGGAGLGTALHGDASGLDRVALPTGTPELRAVHGRGARDVWLGGDDGALLRWDGRRWHTPAVADATVRGLHVAAADDVLVVGGDEGGPPRAWHWNGEALTPIALDAAPAGEVLTAVTRRDEVGLAVGTGGLAFALDDGSRLATGSVDDLLDVDAPSGTVRVVGGSGDGFLARLEDGGLVVEASAVSPLRALDDLGQGTVVAAGDRGVEGVLDTRTGAWTEVDPFTLQAVQDLWISPAGDAWAVGGRPADPEAEATGFVGFSPAPEAP